MKRIFSAVGLLLLLALLYGIHAVRHPRIDVRPNHPDGTWDCGRLHHLIPTATHNRILIKASFGKPLVDAPRIVLAEGGSFQGVRTDTDGYFWYFDLQGLQADTSYELRIQDGAGRNLADPWRIKTLPAPDAHPDHLRILIFTGPGGHDVYQTWLFREQLPIAVRQRLLNRALALEPDIVISSGDQIYYDLFYGKSAKAQGQLTKSIAYAGRFDPGKPVLGTENEEVLKRAVGPQIADLFGTALKSTPSYFLLDDHDYFENDVAIPRGYFCKLCLALQILTLNSPSPMIAAGVSFPPDEFHLELARAAQYLFLPEFLPFTDRSYPLPGTDAPDRPEGVSETYGTVRWGRLFEGLLFESRRYTSLTGEDACMVHPAAEAWLADRAQREEVLWVVDVPATIFGWSAGKWMEWYPEICCGEDGGLTTDKPKYMWQPGWLTQQNRILQAASSMMQAPLFLCGDLHVQAYGMITRSGRMDFRENPVHTVATGALGTDRWGFPSAFRHVLPQVPEALGMVEKLPPVEKDGFAIVDVTPEEVAIRLFAWGSDEDPQKIDTLTPHYVVRIPSKIDPAAYGY